MLPSPAPGEVPFIKDALEGDRSSGGAGRGDGFLSINPRPPPVFVGRVVFIWSLFGIMLSPKRVWNQLPVFRENVIIVDNERNVPGHFH